MPHATVGQLVFRATGFFTGVGLAGGFRAGAGVVGAGVSPAVATRGPPAAGAGGGVRKPRSGLMKWERLGKIRLRFDPVTPNHFARVAEYSSTEMRGIQRPSCVSSGPLTA